jgi:dihydroorotase-like cyclic amidohydrolase
VVEAAAIASLMHLSLATGARVHVAHVSSAEGLEAVRYGKRLGAKVTAETCPHYLFCTEDDLARAGAFGVINPPVRFASDRDALWGGIMDGTIDLVATDHAPFSRAEKEAVTDLLDAPPGHPGLATLLPLMMGAALDGRLSVPKVVDLLSGTPARVFGLYPRKGTLAAGADADVTIYDPRVRRKVRNGEGEGRAADCNLLYDGMDVMGHVHATIVHGAVVYEEGRITAKPGAGRIVRPLAREVQA